MDFHRRFGVPVSIEPCLPSLERRSLRAALIKEEADETCDAIFKGDFAETVDGLCDLLYVVFGTALEFGVDLDAFFDEVHATNMRKEGGNTRFDGKILKPKGWQPPRIAEMLDDGEGKIS